MIFFSIFFFFSNTGIQLDWETCRGGGGWWGVVGRGGREEWEGEETDSGRPVGKCFIKHI